MRISKNGFLLAGCATVGLGVALADQPPVRAGFHSSPSVRPIIVLIGRGDCDSAVDVANQGVVSGDGDIAFLVGRMVSEGICTPKKPGSAAPFFEHALMLGATGSALDWASKIGLGDGVEQSYERAGEVCRTGGVDPQARMSRYALGYACTLGGVTAELLRTTLRRGALEPGTALVAFTPSTGAMEILRTPRSTIPEAESTASRTHPAAIDPAREITRAWNKALGRVPKPDATILDRLTVELPIDLDMTLESAAAGSPGNGGRLQLGQEYPGAMKMPVGMSRDGGH